MKKAKILITGGAGNIGSALATRLIRDSDIHVIIVDNLVTGSIENLPSRINTNWSFIRADVNDFKEISTIMLAHKFDFVFHYAALVGVERTLKNPIKVLNDIDGIKNILDLAKNTEVKRVFYSSSSEVYGEPVELPQYEDTTPLNSRLPYAIVKNLGEAFFRTYKSVYGLDYTIFRFFNTYGPNQSQDFVVTKFIESALKNEPIEIYGDGSQTRTFCFIDDNVEATCNALYDQKFLNEVVNIGSNVEVSIKNLARMIVQKLDSKSEVIHRSPLKEGDMTRRQPDISKMRQLLDRDLVSIEDGIDLMIEYHQTRK